MKNYILINVLMTLFFSTSQAQNSNMEKELKRTLTSYLSAGDGNDAISLAKYLHESFRVALYDGKEDIVKILDKETYTMLVGNKTFGGYPRRADYKSIDIIGENMASVQLVLTSSGKPTLKNFYSLVKVGGKWFVLQDFVVLIP